MKIFLKQQGMLDFVGKNRLENFESQGATCRDLSSGDDFLQTHGIIAGFGGKSELAASGVNGIGGLGPVSGLTEKWGTEKLF